MPTRQPGSTTASTYHWTRAQAQLRLVGDLYARAMDLGAGNHDPELAVLELISLSGGDPVALELARGRCLALLDLDPTTRAPVECSSC
jgi:hypothetical protein